MFNELLGTNSNCLFVSKLESKRWLRIIIGKMYSKVWEKPLVKYMSL